MDPTSSTNFNSHLFVTRGTVEQTECKAKILRNKRTHKFIRRSRLFRDFAKSSFYDNHQFLVYILYADDVPLKCNQKVIEFHILQGISFIIFIPNN